jgi:hypothetical protein
VKCVIVRTLLLTRESLLAGLAEALSDEGCGLDAGSLLRLPPP